MMTTDRETPRDPKVQLVVGRSARRRVERPQGLEHTAAVQTRLRESRYSSSGAAQGTDCGRRVPAAAQLRVTPSS